MMCGVCKVSSSLHLMISSDLCVVNLVLLSMACRNVTSNGFTCFKSSNRPTASQFCIKRVGVGVSSAEI